MTKSENKQKGKTKENPKIPPRFKRKDSEKYKWIVTRGVRGEPSRVSGRSGATCDGGVGETCDGGNLRLTAAAKLNVSGDDAMVRKAVALVAVATALAMAPA